MSRQPNVTYAMIAECCHELQDRGDKPSVRKIHQRLGGSFSTISQFFQRWLEEQTLANRMEPEVSEPFRQAILAEYARVTEGLRQKLEAQLAIERAQLKEALGLLAEQESSIEQVNQAFDQFKKEVEAQHIVLEKKLSSAQALTEEHSKRAGILEEQLENMRNRLHEAELKSAISETQGRDLEKQNQRLEQEIQELKGQTRGKGK